MAILFFSDLTDAEKAQYLKLVVALYTATRASAGWPVDGPYPATFSAHELTWFDPVAAWERLYHHRAITAIKRQISNFLDAQVTQRGYRTYDQMSFNRVYLHYAWDRHLEADRERYQRFVICERKIASQYHYPNMQKH